MEFAHGKGGSTSIIHKLLNGGAFPEDANVLRARYDTPQQMIDEPLRLVKASPKQEVRAFAKALRG